MERKKGEPTRKCVLLDGGKLKSPPWLEIKWEIDRERERREGRKEKTKVKFKRNRIAFICLTLFHSNNRCRPQPDRLTFFFTTTGLLGKN